MSTRVWVLNLYSCFLFYTTKTFIYLSAFIVPSKICKLPIPYAIMRPIPSEMLAFELNADDTLEGLPPL